MKGLLLGFFDRFFFFFYFCLCKKTKTDYVNIFFISVFVFVVVTYGLLIDGTVWRGVLFSTFLYVLDSI